MAKIRMGFVSNSSSSSFIIARAQVGDEKFEKVIEYVKQLDCYPEVSKNYLFVDTSDGSFCDEDLEELGIMPGDYMHRFD